MSGSPAAMMRSWVVESKICGRVEGARSCAPGFADDFMAVNGSVLANNAGFLDRETEGRSQMFELRLQGRHKQRKGNVLLIGARGDSGR